LYYNYLKKNVFLLYNISTRKMAVELRIYYKEAERYYVLDALNLGTLIDTKKRLPPCGI